MFKSREPGTPWAHISAHQGGSEQARPGTYEAYQQSAATGAEYVEFDIRRTADRALVVYHDGWAGESRRPVPDLRYGELCKIAGYQVPLVEDVMRLLAGRVAGHLDLKETGYETEVIELALATFGPANFVATTLEDPSIVAIKRSFPEVRTALSLGRDLREVPRARRLSVRASELTPLSRIRGCGADWVAVHYHLARLGVMRACRRNGIGMMVFTVDSDRLIGSFLADRAVEVVITNRPRRAVQYRTANHGTANHGTANHGTADHGTANHGTIQRTSVGHVAETTGAEIRS
jgi:glycerophosphoryl diester phosphodiesterase